MKAIYFTSFYLRVFNSVREIRENKNFVKISTYTVYTNDWNGKKTVITKQKWNRETQQ